MWKKQGSWNFFHAKLIPNSSNYMGQKINFYGVVVSIWTNGFFRKMDNKGEEEVENYVCFLS